MSGTAVLLMGPMRAGKTTTGNLLTDRLGIPRYALADKLKELHHVVTGSLEKDREWLQTQGAAHRVVFGEDFWTQALINEIGESKSFVVDDIRYPNELKLLHEFSHRSGKHIIPVYIKCSMETRVLRGGEANLMAHESEQMSVELGNSIREENGQEYTVSDVIPGEKIMVIDGNLPLPLFCFELKEQLFPKIRGGKREERGIEWYQSSSPAEL